MREQKEPNVNVTITMPIALRNWMYAYVRMEPKYRGSVARFIQTLVKNVKESQA